MHSLQSAAVILLLVSFEIEGRNIKISNCGKRLVDRKALITGGSQKTHWPWHAAIYHKGKKPLPEYKCGGTLINANSVLTAAHCISKDDEPLAPSNVLVSLGKLNLNVDESISIQSFEIAKIFQHPDYTSIDLANDIAIIRLSTASSFNNYVRPVCLWPSNKLESSEVVGREGTVVGWGFTETGETSNVLQQAYMPVVHHGKCLKSNRDFFGTFLSDSNFCAGFRNGTSVCQGDSGGSMTFEENGLFYIRGIVSVGVAKVDHATRQGLICDSNQFAIFTDVERYLTWIDEVVSGVASNECEINVQCSISSVHFETDACSIDLNIEISQQNCKIVFTDSTETETEVTRLTVGGKLEAGKLEAIPDLSDALAKFKNLKALELSGNNIKIVDETKLAAFKRIESLYLTDNQITEFEFGTFDDLKNLRVLHLNNNNLTEIDQNLFSELRELKDLYLNENQLTSLPPDLFRNNTKLEELVVHSNNLTEIDRNLVGELTELKELWLNDNQLKSLPPGLFRNNTKLEILSVQSNHLTEIDRNLFSELGELKELRLSYNQLKSLPSDVFRNNSKLEKLVVSSNNLTEIDQNLFSALHNLTYLNLNDNQLEILPQGLFRHNTKLREIWAANNKIREIEFDFKNLLNLRMINFIGNECIDWRCWDCDDFDRRKLIDITAN